MHKTVVIPTVSVTEVGVSAVPTTIEIIGTISARYDMPIGVEGDAGRVAAIYVEAGDHVKRGQVLARLNVTVLQPQVTNLEAALEQSRAEAELADAEYHRAVAVGPAGALSAEETQRRQIERGDGRGQGQGGRGHAGRGRGQARARRGAGARGRRDPDPELRGGARSPRRAGRRCSGCRRTANRNCAARSRSKISPLLKLGQEVTVKLTGSTRAYPGQVRLLGAVIDPQTRLGTVRVSLKPDPDLRPGAFARAEVTVSHAERTVLPQTAVLTDDKGSYVLVVTPTNTLERRAVHVSGMGRGRRHPQ